MVEKIRELANLGYNKRQVAKLLGITVNMVLYRARKYNILFQNKKPRKPTEEEKHVLRERFFELYKQGMPIMEIVKRLGVSRTTAQLWEMDIDIIKKDLMKKDPRSKVCQQINSCSHSRCHLAPRCPAYQAYVLERIGKGLS